MAVAVAFFINNTLDKQPLRDSGLDMKEIGIKIDPTKTHMIMKTMIGDQTYYDKMVYIDKDGLILGSFDSCFFYEDSPTRIEL